MIFWLYYKVIVKPTGKEDTQGKHWPIPTRKESHPSIHPQHFGNDSPNPSQTQHTNRPQTVKRDCNVLYQTQRPSYNSGQTQRHLHVPLQRLYTKLQQRNFQKRSKHVWQNTKMPSKDMIQDRSQQTTLTSKGTRLTFRTPKSYDTQNQDMHANF